MKTTPSQVDLLQWVDDQILNTAPVTPPGSPKKQQEMELRQAFENDLFVVLSASSDSSRPRSTAALPTSSQSPPTESLPSSAAVRPFPFAGAQPYSDSAGQLSDQQPTKGHQQNVHSSETSQMREVPVEPNARPNVRNLKRRQSAQRSRNIQYLATNYLEEHFGIASLTKGFKKSTIPDDSSPVLKNRNATKNNRNKHLHAVQQALNRIKNKTTFKPFYKASELELQKKLGPQVGKNRLFVTAIGALLHANLLAKGEKIPSSSADISMSDETKTPPRS
jgi:hypothetical protein